MQKRMGEKKKMEFLAWRQRVAELEMMLKEERERFNAIITVAGRKLRLSWDSNGTPCLKGYDKKSFYPDWIQFSISAAAFRWRDGEEDDLTEAVQRTIPNVRLKYEREKK